MFQRQIHGLTQHELTTELLENLRQNRVNHRLADAFNQAFERTKHAFAALFIQHLFEQHQSACGRIDQGAVRLALMRRPVAIAHFVFEQGHACAHIGHAQNRLSQTHQCQTLGIGQLVLREHRLHPTRRLAVAHRVDQLGCVLDDVCARGI